MFIIIFKHKIIFYFIFNFTFYFIFLKNIFSKILTELAMEILAYAWTAMEKGGKNSLRSATHVVGSTKI